MNWEIKGIKALGIILIISGLYWTSTYKKIRKGQEPFTGRKVIETNINYTSQIGGISPQFS